MLTQQHFDEIRQIINDNYVVLFMKGTKTSPMCGFSSIVVAILRKLNIEFKDVNVLESNDIREAIKTYTDWPTIPQLYVNKEFIGGCDIVRDLYESGELEKIIKQSNQQ